MRTRSLTPAILLAAITACTLVPSEAAADEQPCRIMIGGSKYEQEQIDEGLWAEEPPPPPAGAPFAPPVDPQGFWARYPDRAAGMTTAVRATVDGPWSTPAGAAAWDRLLEVSVAMHHDAGAILGRINAFGRATPVAMSTSTEVLYVYSTLAPTEVAASGFSSPAARWAAAADGDLRSVDIGLAASPLAEGDTIFTLASRDPDLLSLMLPIDGQETSWFRYRIVRPQGAGIDVHAALTHEASALEARRYGWSSAVTARAGVLFTEIPPAWITHADELQYIDGRFILVSSQAAPGHGLGELLGPELAGARVPEAQPGHPQFPMFDWYLPEHGETTFTFARSDFPEDAAPADFIVWSKHTERWEEFPVASGLTDAELVRAGFIRATWPEPGSRTFWVPQPTQHYSVLSPDYWVAVP